MEKFDLIVIGSGPAGEKAAVKAAYFGYRVAIIEKEDKYGGAGVNTGTLPSKTLKETALFFSGKYEKGLFGVDRTLKHQATVEDFMYRKNYVVTSEGDEVEKNLHKHKVEVFKGIASFLDPHTLTVKQEKGEVTLFGNYIIIATGSYPFHPPEIPFDGVRVHDSDTILNITRIPQSICIVGAGVIGCEYVTIFANMGCKVYLVNRTDQILPFIDKEITAHLLKIMEKDNVEIFFNDSVKFLNVPSSDREYLRIGLESNNWLHVDMFLYAAGRCGQTKQLNLEKAGIKPGKREQMEVDENYRTSQPNIYAVGDCIGFPALASTSMDQGRVAVTHIFNTGDLDDLAKVIPYGIYTIPEVSMVGVTEEEALQKNMNYCVGRARYADMSRGKIMGASDGFLKIIFTRDDLIIRGVSIIGHLATEIIHFGLSLVDNKKTVMQTISTVFNYPTLHDLYKYAAYDGLGNLSGHKVKD
jgi:NAD(P) transhydrogenase